jgi:acetyl esterase/lipase
MPAREFPPPNSISAAAQRLLSSERQPQIADFPHPDDKAGWREFVEACDAAILPQLQQALAQLPVHVDTIEKNSVRLYEAAPFDLASENSCVILDIHGGALILGGGKLCRLMAAATAMRLQSRLWSVDYRMPPDHPYPAALDDCLTAYKALLKEREPHQIIVSGVSGGGNLAAALLLRARDEGLPLPAGALLMTPEIDLTESGDSFQTNLGVDPVLRSLMPVNLLYADGHDLAHPYLSPLFGDFTKGFPPTLLTTGTRDLYLSNTVLFHRALRSAGVNAELHVLEAAGHNGFPGTPEGEELDRELRQFINRIWQSTDKHNS